MTARRLFRAGPLLLAAALAGGLAAVPGTAQAAQDTVVGTLVVAWPEHEQDDVAADRGADAPLSWVETDDGDSVRVPTEDLQATADVPVGATVRVTVGRTVTDEASTEDGFDAARDVVAATVVAPAPTDPPVAGTTSTPTDEVTVVRVVPRGTGTPSGGPTTADLVNRLNTGVATFWSANSGDRIRLHATAAQSAWLTVGTDCGDPTALWNDVQSRIGWTRGTGKHLMVYLPPGSAGCGYGLGEVGWSLTAGGRFYVQDDDTSVMAHELGHNFGLGHSSELQCDGFVEDGVCPADRFTAPYNDLYDVMGYSGKPVGTLNVAQADRLGLLPDDQKTTANTWAPTATYTLAPVSAATGLRAVELVDPSGTEYWLEYRQASGQDAWLAGSGLQTGVTLRRSDLTPYASDSSLLLDPTPSRWQNWPYDVSTAFPVGTAVPVGLGDFTVTVQSVGATAVVQVSPGATPAGARYAATGGPSGPLGAPRRPLVCGLAGGGCFRLYTTGAVYWSPASAASIVNGPLGDRWGALGAERGILGYPVGDAVCGLPNGGCGQDFQVGSLYTSASTAPKFVRGSILTAWRTAGGPSGALGYPTTDEMCGLRNGGCFQFFQHAGIYWTAATGARVITGPIGDRWGALGAERSVLGYPVADAVCGLPDSGCGQDFQFGSLFAGDTTPARFVRGSILARWRTAGGAAGALGFPTTDERCGLRGGGCVQFFQHGTVYWSPTTGAHTVTDPLLTTWASSGFESGRLGYPLEEPHDVGGNTVQRFQGGTLTYVPADGVVRIS